MSRQPVALVDDAAAAGVVLAIEPMHPIYAADRGVISTLGQALDIAEGFPATAVGVPVRGRAAHGQGLRRHHRPVLVSGHGRGRGR